MKAFLLIVLLANLLFSSERDIETKIYKLIIDAIFPNQKEIQVWTDEYKKAYILNRIPSVRVIENPKNADLLIIKKPIKEPAEAIIFTSTYRTLKYYEKNAIGGFYWQKGRPNILFLSPNLQKNHITLPNSMDEYIEKFL